jgi:hypothetical protein
MAYSAEISRRNPTCFLFLIDQSGSMSEPFGNNPNIRKADGVADALNRCLAELVSRATKGDEILDRYFVGIIGYGADVGFTLGGTLQSGELLPISQIAMNPLRVERRDKTIYDGAGGLTTYTVNFPIWFEPKAEGPTPMFEALELAYRALEAFVQRYPNAYPPVVMNLTDGQPTDESGRTTPRVSQQVESSAQRIRNLQTTDGQVLLFNLHISASRGAAIWFPDNESVLPDEYARLMFRMSSVMPGPLIAAAKKMLPEQPISEAARGFIYQGDLESVIRFFDIGTRPTQPTVPR